MTDFKPQLVEQLNTILPTYYELALDTTTPFPCISYQEVDNSAREEGDTIRYSNIIFQIKIWGKSPSELAPYVEKLDNKMYALKFTRLSYNELTFDSEHICLIFRYQATAYELI